MATYVQANRPLAVITPLGKDILLLVGLAAQETVSRLFNFQLTLIAENKKEIAFDKLLGQKITATLILPNGKARYFNGICNRVSQGERDREFTRYRLEIVPQFWLLTRRAQSRIFQRMAVPDILAEVLEGVDVTFELCGHYEPRDYCVQYRETDFNFASRLMEEEGIFYFFKHSDGAHKMVVADAPQSHPDLQPAAALIYEDIEGGARDEERVYDWEKVQELRAGKYTLWDHTFELPHKHLEAEQLILESVQTGQVAHKLKVGNNEQLEIYDWPGEYAQRFDGVDRGGGDQAAELQKIFQDNERTVNIRMQQEAAAGLLIQGASNCRHLTSGHKFTLTRHFNADGQYVITGVTHSASLSASDYRSGGGEFHYHNNFTCIPAALPFRPPRLTPKPVVQGTQTAVVVGPPGEEIFTDKYGRVKVQFHWDRQGKNDADSSCWIRVGTLWAGARWGGINIPRIGQEVIVDFLEGDPDQPLIVGSVYNAELMPPYELPAHKTRSTLKSRSTMKGGPANFNEIRFEDKKGAEQVFINAERDLDLRVEHDAREFVGNDRHLIVKANQRELVEADKDEHVKGNQREKIDGDVSLQIGGKQDEKIGTIYAVESGQEIHLKAGMKIIIESGLQISLKGPGGFVDIGPAGVTIQGNIVLINSGGSAGSGSGTSAQDPQAPDVADDGSKGGKLS